MKKYYKMLSLALVLLFINNYSYIDVHAYNSSALETKTVLFINSYHSGYKWSDDIFDGIKSVLNSDYANIKLQVEYMDTQRVVDSQYLQLLLDTYRYKFSDRNFDLIISSDDAAFEFLLKYGDELFPNTPVVFCGVNYFEQQMINTHSLYTGVVEGFDIGATIDTAIKLHPETKTVYYVVDDTTTGVSIMREFSNVIPEYSDRLDFIKLDKENLRKISNSVHSLPQNSIILYLIYFKDNQGNHYDYYEAVSMIEQNCSIPIYGVWNFTLGHGIVGGKLTSGFYQGKTAAEIAIRILNGEHPSNIPVVTEKTTSYEFDFKQLEKHNIPLELLPQNSIVINVAKPSKKQILILNSYNKGLKWTDDLELGIKSKLDSSMDNIEFTYEFMDVQRNTDPVYLQHLYELLIRKYRNKQFDLVISTDDVAFNFVKMYHDKIFRNVPVIFCGVNYFEESMIQNHALFTGVVESYDLKGTIDVALQIHPKVNNIIVINDTTVTGQANRKNLELILPFYEGVVFFEIWDNYNMPEIQEKVKTIKNDSIILLLSFNRDKSNNNFSYDESISMISKNASVPIYGVWDFYLGKGLLGGVLTSGFTHGQTVGDMAISILSGKKPSEIPVVINSPNIYMFDYSVLKKFNLSLKNLPMGSIVINKPNSIIDYYTNNRKVFVSLVSIFTSLCIIVLLMYINIRSRKIAEEKERFFALTDSLTGVPNRRAGIEHLTKQIKKSQESDFQTTICFIDVNDLKVINDTFGHREGDNLLTMICLLIKSTLREVDMLCRFAGDEFLIIFDDLSLEKAKHSLELITTTLEEYNRTGDSPYDISISYGFAQYNKDACESIDDLIEKADNAMYENKLSNRNLLLEL